MLKQRLKDYSQSMQEEKKMLCLRFDDKNLEFDYLIGLSIWLPSIFLFYFVLKFVLHLLTHPPPNITNVSLAEHLLDNAKNRSDVSLAEHLLDDVKNRSDVSLAEHLLDDVKNRSVQQAVVYRFRQRQEKIQREIKRQDESMPKLIAKVEEEGSCVSKSPRGLRVGDLVRFSHRHPLLRFHLRGTEVIRCNMCNIVISGVAYGCDLCDYFLHEVCSNVPKRIRHDFHPMHSLTLLPISSEVVIHCVACGYDNSCTHHSLFSFYYHCNVCKYDLHLECASVPTTLIKRVKYPLYLFNFFPLETEGAPLLCGICNQVMINRQSSWLFYNREFDYICHFECAAEEEVGVLGDHSFLSEVQKSLHLQKSCHDQQPKLGHEVGEVTHFSHRHPLKAFKQTNEASSSSSSSSIMICSICSSKSSSGGYICHLCNYFIDESCFPLPRKIQHHFHPNHPLILASYNDHLNFKCYACPQEVGAAYHCSVCKFSLHRSCAGAPMTLTLGTNMKFSYKLLCSYPYEEEMGVIKCSHCSKELYSKQSLLYYNFDLDEVLHVQCALDKEANSYDTKFLLASERLKRIKLEEDYS